MNKKFSYPILLSVLLLGFASCNHETEIDALPNDCQPLALRGIHAVIEDGGETRAVAPLVDAIGKYQFLDQDEIIFTKIERTRRPIRPTFSYSDVHYSCEVSGQNVSWKRQNPQEDIYWSDGSEPHTFIGYILPHEDNKTASASGYDWYHDTGRDIYYGSIGNPVDTDESIDYMGDSVPAADRLSPIYDTERLRKEDLLLTYSTEMQNEDAMAWIRFHHALASIRVVVTITGYSSTGSDPDAQTRVTNMKVLNQPTMYKWDNKGYKADPLEEGDQLVLNGFWGGTAPAWNQKKNMKLWQPREYRGSGVSRTFTFYGITVPGDQEKVEMEFSVSYPDPLDPNQNPATVHRLERNYKATLDLGNNKKVEFRPGYCTNITINLNHKDEKMTVGAEYMSWQYDDNPNEGSLRKNSTFLSNTNRTSITIASDSKATIDDATWLYVEKDANNQDVIKDIYGHTGTATDPYTICTADQLLSFAYEVKDGRDFLHKYVKLDADITMQPTASLPTKKVNDVDVLDESKLITWIGIGDASHPFNGFFLGSSRYINNLYGEHFFHTVGDNAVIDKLNFADVIELQGCGVVAHKNLGLICGCYIDGAVKEINDQTDYTGSIVGENDSFIIACAHVGSVTGAQTVGGLVGFNNGTIMASYHAGEIKALPGSTNANLHATVGLRGDGSIMFSCYYNADSISHTPTLQPGKSGYPLTTNSMQTNAFVNAVNQVFLYGNEGSYTIQDKTLRQAVLEILGPEHDSKTDAELIQELLQDGVTSSNVQKLFEYHFSLNEALHVFKVWLDAIAASGAETVETNCHTFTKLQIQFLQQHYTAEHKYIYTPATYPKVQ